MRLGAYETSALRHWALCGRHCPAGLRMSATPSQGLSTHHMFLPTTEPLVLEHLLYITGPTRCARMAASWRGAIKSHPLLTLLLMQRSTCAGAGAGAPVGRDRSGALRAGGRQLARNREERHLAGGSAPEATQPGRIRSCGADVGSTALRKSYRGADGISAHLFYEQSSQILAVKIPTAPDLTLGLLIARLRLAGGRVRLMPW